jgi:hypothetical protein
MATAVISVVDRLGLKLKKRRGPVQTLVIDRVERPGEEQVCGSSDALTHRLHGRTTGILRCAQKDNSSSSAVYEARTDIR